MSDPAQAPSGAAFAGRLGLGTLGLLLAGFAVVIGADAAFAQATGARESEGVIAALLRWAPLILLGPPGQIAGFVLNILISILSMALGTVAGVVLGSMLISQVAPLQRAAWAVTQFFRNAPWLVLLFFATLLMPYDLHVAGITLPLPAWLKGTIGLALPVMANVAEIVRGAVQSIPTAQWEASESLAFTRGQTFRLVILPQCLKRMLPPWMNLYAILTMATTLVSIMGVADAMTLTQQALAAEGKNELLLPFYLALMILFFLYCYPIAWATSRLERRFAVIS